ncbi:MAG: hypothetical protein ACLQM8_26620 [Limisphaerales bacterium]
MLPPLETWFISRGENEGELQRVILHRTTWAVAIVTAQRTTAAAPAKW